MAGERIDGMPPSMSFTPALDPASRAVTRSLLPLTVVPTCFVPLESVASGSPRSHAPVAAVSVPFGLVCQPRLVSKVSENTEVPPPPWQDAGTWKPFVGERLLAPPLTALLPRPNPAKASQIRQTSSPP